jgi:pyrimidine-nucleoside phosphorylase
MTARELILRKRNGGVLTPGEIEWLVGEYTANRLPDYQMAAFLMAVYFSGMDPDESAAFTDVMFRSGTVLDLSAVPGRKVDKHSTGGVGDKVSLIAAPMAAACGVPVPMISGRGLGHTGGTLDKLESIPGFCTRLTEVEFVRLLARTGLVFAGQTDDIAPADRRIYALRDVTGTIESLPLIAGSIMSKKLAEGIDALVLDVKVGNGAFMRTAEEGRRLAELLVGIGTASGKRTIAFLTAMNEPLGYAAGNWVEVAEAAACLRGRRVPDLMEVSLVIAGAMVYLGEKAGSIEEGMRRCLSSLWSGDAYERLLLAVEAQGGDGSLLRQPDRYATPRHTADITAPGSGTVVSIDTYLLGTMIVELGAGRLRLEDNVDANAGVVLRKKVGDRVVTGEVLGVLQSDRLPIPGDMVRRASSGFRIGAAKVQAEERVIAVVDESGLRPWKTPQII